MRAPGVVWMNGRLPADKALLSVTDRGFQLGDGVFETLRVVGGKVLELAAHMSRLEESAATLGIAVPADLEASSAGPSRQVCVANELDLPRLQAAVRVTATRGSVTWARPSPAREVSSNLVVQAWPADPPSPGLLDKGLSLVVSSVRRDPASPLARVEDDEPGRVRLAQLEATAPRRRRRVSHHRRLYS